MSSDLLCVNNGRVINSFSGSSHVAFLFQYIAYRFLGSSEKMVDALKCFTVKTACIVANVFQPL